MDNKFTSMVERNKAASRLCKQLFSVWCKNPTMGELQRIVIGSWDQNLNDEAILAAGNWWLWMRNLFIENTLTRNQKGMLIQAAIVAAHGKEPINIVSARSPELLHAQVEGQGDQTLPRSRKALMKLKEITLQSEKFLPTSVSIIFADLAIDNFERINESCDVESTIQENIKRLQEMAVELELKNLQIIRISELVGPRGKLRDVLTPDGRPLVSINLDQRAVNLIATAGKESVQSHMKMFGWTESQSLEHTKNIAITMGLVGQSIKSMNGKSILIHNESFITRGMLNNIFNPVENPLSVIALRDLLETKRVKE